MKRTLKDAVREALETRGERVFFRTLFIASLAGKASTGRTTHRRYGRILPKPASLAIRRLDSDPGFFLVYFDDSGDVMTDTYHDSLAGAFSQAHFEFTIDRSEWQETGGIALDRNEWHQ